VTAAETFHRLRPRRWWHWALIVIGGLIVLGAVSPSDPQQAASAPTAAPVAPVAATVTQTAVVGTPEPAPPHHHRHHRAHAAHRARPVAQQQPAPAAPPPAASFPASYGGLGATAAAFRQHNPTHAPAVPVPGVATYTIEGTDSQGRVTAYSVQITAQPPMGNAERMFLTEGINLPDDTRGVHQTSTCESFRSRTLGAVLGREYAVTRTETGTDTAQIALATTPDC
jgi:hypothetical protein